MCNIGREESGMAETAFLSSGKSNLNYRFVTSRVLLFSNNK
jgi:hypothetical protein